MEAVTMNHTIYTVLKLVVDWDGGGGEAVCGMPLMFKIIISKFEKQENKMFEANKSVKKKKLRESSSVFNPF